MPSPFPGMDPYLENPSEWPDFHLEIISAIKQALNDHLLPRYHARAEDRVYISREDDSGRQMYVADVAVHVESDIIRQPSSATTVAAPIETITMLEEEVREHYLAIYDNQQRAVVTVIEVLSPTNKLVGSEGYLSYRAKRADLQRSSTNLVEIDLLRTGAKTLRVPQVVQSDYYVHVSKHWARPQGSVWPIQLTQALPKIAIPLAVGDTDITLDLQAVLNAVYERSRYGSVINYQREPVPPLPPHYVQWADALLREKGLRT